MKIRSYSELHDGTLHVPLILLKPLLAHWISQHLVDYSVALTRAWGNLWVYVCLAQTMGNQKHHNRPISLDSTSALSPKMHWM